MRTVTTAVLETSAPHRYYAATMWNRHKTYMIIIKSLIHRANSGPGECQDVL